MMAGYEKIIHGNLSRIYGENAEALASKLPAAREKDTFRFTAFGEECRIGRELVALSGKPNFGPRGLLISLYALHAQEGPIQLEPFRAFKDFPGSMPYQGGFGANSERILVPHVVEIKGALDRILPPLGGQVQPKDVAGDFSFLLFPLPKIALCYIFYLPDEDFPASVTCLFSFNAIAFMPLDGLADVAEYTSKKIIELRNP